MLVQAGRVLLFWSIIIYHRSIIICLDRHVDFSFRYTLRTVDHNWPTVDHDWAWLCTTFWSIIICHTKLKLSGQTSSTFHLMGSLTSNHFLYTVYNSCDFFLRVYDFFRRGAMFFSYDFTKLFPQFLWIYFSYTRCIRFRDSNVKTDFLFRGPWIFY